MRIYIAAAYIARDTIREHLLPLIPERHQVRTSWLDATHALHAGTIGASLDSDQDYIDKHTEEDFEEVRAADAVVLLTESYMRQLPELQHLPSEVFTTGGRHVETGFALALGKPVVLVGEPENVFHRSSTQIVSTLEGAVKVLDLLDTLRSTGRSEVTTH